MRIRRSGTHAGRILCFATQGASSNDEDRIVGLLAGFDPVVYRFERTHKAANIARIVRTARADDISLIVMEGTGLSGGVAVMLSRALAGTPYLVSTGDAVGPFVGGQRKMATIPGWLYELALYRLSAGVIGWTPYLVGRALTLGAPRAMTVASSADSAPDEKSRSSLRQSLGIPAESIVFGIAGSLAWSRRHDYCYGLELVEAVLAIDRADVVVLIVGDGPGRERLLARGGSALGRRVFLPGAVPRNEVMAYLGAMDVGSLPQSTDQVGSFRYGTKLAEYHAARLPFVTGEIPMGYDLALDWTWRLPGDGPWSALYVTALADLMSRVSHAAIACRRDAIPELLPAFEYPEQRRRVEEFVNDVLAAGGRTRDALR